MYDYLEPLLLNMLFLVVFLLFIPHLLETNVKSLSSNQKKLLKVASVTIALLSCMMFPFRIGDEIIMDLRTVAILFGGLYLGRKATLFLVFVFLAFRLYIGGIGSGFYASLIGGIIIFVVLMLLNSVFNKSMKHKKILIACSFSLFISTLALFLHSVLFQHLTMLNFMAGAAFFLIHLLSTFFIVYFYEMLQESAYINQQVIKAEKLEVVSHLASSISHEVRNPLTVVKGFLQMLTQNDLEEDKKNKFIGLSLQEIERASDIIEDYLNFAKPAQQEHTTIDLTKQLKRSIDIISPMANMQCVEVHINVNQCYTIGDAPLLQQCFLNVIKNCIEAMPNGGNLFITAKEINGAALIEITDDGEGMTKEQLRRIGEPFFTTKGREGTGLGMMAVFKIIEMMNGKLEVTSKINEGTQFRIYFPAFIAK